MTGAVGELEPEFEMESNALVVSAGRRAESTRYERMDEPRPGTYWRLRKKITGKEDAQVSCNAHPADTVLLLEHVEFADGQAHVYAFAPHPSWPENEAYQARFHADVFYIYWEPCPDGAQVRERELLALTRDMEQTQALMLQPPPDAKPVASLGYNPAAPAYVPGHALATQGQLRDMTAYAEVLRANAEATTAWITTHSKTLQKHGKALARFHMERANVGMASAKAQLDGVKGILRTVENLQLYTGSGIELLTLRAGEPATPEAPLTIYQECLALDEELLLHLEHGGLDHTHLESVAEVLADQGLVARLIPAERGIVLCKFRNSYKEFVKQAPGDVGAAMANAQLNRISQLHMLLVRDGERVYLVYGPEFLQSIGQLMPSAAEQIGHYTDRWGTEIRREHLAYAAAQREQLGALDGYAKVLIMLWGLADRAELFAEWDRPGFASWLDWDFQNQYLRLVDQSFMIAVVRPSYAAYRSEQNRYLGAGACVAVRLAPLFRWENIPGAFSKRETEQYRGKWGYNLLYTYTCGEVLIATVRSDKRGGYVEVPLKYDGYSSEPKRDITGKLYLPRETLENVLVLDRVHAADLTYYLTSREQRRSYNEYVQLFQGARKWVSARDAEEAPMREELRRAVAEARLQHDPDALEASITAAMAIARTSRRDKKMPAPGGTGFAAYRQGALDTLHALLTDQNERVAVVDAWCQAQDRLPLRLVSTGKGEFKLYLEPTTDEHDPRLGEIRHATSAVVTFGADGGLTLGERQRELLRPAASEHVIHDWQRTREVPGNPKARWEDERKPSVMDTGAALWLKHQSTLDPLRYDQAEALLALPARQSAWFKHELDLDRLFATAVGSRKHYIVRRSVRIAIGLVHYGGMPCLLLAEHDALAYCYNAGDDAMKQACLHLIATRYAKPEAAIAKLKRAGEFGWKAEYSKLANLWPYRDDPHCAEFEDGSRLDLDAVVDPLAPDRAENRRSVRCLRLTAVGAELFPELARRTQGAM